MEQPARDPFWAAETYPQRAHCQCGQQRRRTPGHHHHRLSGKGHRCCHQHHRIDRRCRQHECQCRGAEGALAEHPPGHRHRTTFAAGEHGATGSRHQHSGTFMLRQPPRKTFRWNECRDQATDHHAEYQKRHGLDEHTRKHCPGSREIRMAGSEGVHPPARRREHNDAEHQHMHRPRPAPRCDAHGCGRPGDRHGAHRVTAGPYPGEARGPLRRFTGLSVGTARLGQLVLNQPGTVGDDGDG